MEVKTLLARVTASAEWHRHEEHSFKYDDVLADGSHTNQLAEQHRQDAMLLEEIIGWIT